MVSGAPRIAGALFLGAVLLVGCQRDQPEPRVEPGPAEASTAARPDGHRRMLALLQQVAEESAEVNSFLGQAPARVWRERLAAIAPGTRDDLRWRCHRELGAHELRLGNNEKALEHLVAAYELVPRLRDEMPPLAPAQTALALAVAYLRQGEVRNCGARHTGEACILPIRGSGIHVDPQPSNQAIRYLTEVLEQTPSDSPEQVTARWLLNLAYMTIGGYPDQVPGPYLIPLETLGDDRKFPRFVNIAPRLGLGTFDLAGGAVAEDFDGDGFLDLMTSTSDTSGPMRYFRNNGDGSFSERTEQAGLSGLLGGLNLLQADYDNDGDVDVLVLRGAWWGATGRHPNSLLRNNGDGTFTDVTFEAGLGEVNFPTQTAGWADYENDGDVDLYIGNEHGRRLGAPGQLFRNNGDGTFVDVAEEAGVRNDAYAKGVAWGDYDGDWYPDLFVSNMGSANRLYHNNGDGTFTDVAGELGVTGPRVSFPAWFWDYDNDGALDLMVFAYGGGPASEPDVWFVAAGYLGLPHTAELARLYQGDGSGGFRDVAEELNLGRPTLPMGSNFGDLNNDGFPDFYLGTGYPHFRGLMPNVMYLNEQGTRFVDVTVQGGFGHLQKGHAIVFADLDNDGDQDVFEQMGGQYPGDAFANALFENPGFSNHWLALRLVGVRSNRAGVGVRIRAEIVENGRRRSVYKHVNSGGSFGASPLGRQHLGLGRADRVERLVVYWPASDTTQTFLDSPVDRYLEITEGADTYRELPYDRIRF